MGQTDNQLGGTAENISFAYLRDGDYDSAYANAASVERSGLFAWNELVRVLAGSRVGASRRELAVARQNVSHFPVALFSLCELEALLSADDYVMAVAIIRTEHGGADVGCRPS